MTPPPTSRSTSSNRSARVLTLSEIETIKDLIEKRTEVVRLQVLMEMQENINQLRHSFDRTVDSMQEMIENIIGHCESNTCDAIAIQTVQARTAQILQGMTQDIASAFSSLQPGLGEPFTQIVFPIQPSLSDAEPEVHEPLQNQDPSSSQHLTGNSGNSLEEVDAEMGISEEDEEAGMTVDSPIKATVLPAETTTTTELGDKPADRPTDEPTDRPIDDLTETSAQGPKESPTGNTSGEISSNVAETSAGLTVDGDQGMESTSRTGDLETDQMEIS